MGHPPLYSIDSLEFSFKAALNQSHVADWLEAEWLEASIIVLDPASDDVRIVWDIRAHRLSHVHTAFVLSSPVPDSSWDTAETIKERKKGREYYDAQGYVDVYTGQPAGGGASGPYEDLNK